MPRINMPFGSGLDRETGVMATAPGSFEALKNLVLVEGKAIVRRGFALVDSYTYAGSAVDAILGIWPMRSEGATIVAAVATDATYGRVVVLYKAAPDGSAPTPLAFNPSTTATPGLPSRAWWFQAAGTDNPIIHAADSYGKLYLAHDDVYGRRAPTIVYNLSSRWLSILEANLDGTSNKPVYFRGVVRHLAYLMGWGFGTASQPDRPEVVRTSKPAEPDVFLPEHYWIAGQQREPVVQCVSLGKELAVLKETDSYEIFGYSRDTFGIRPLDPLRGVGAPRLALSIQGVLFAWGEVPWVWQAGEPGGKEISPPLDLMGPDPADLVAAGEAAGAFVTYHPRNQIVLFVFGPRVYCLSLRAQPWKWSYWELGFTPTCGNLLYTAGAALPAPTGWVEALPTARWAADAIRSTQVRAKIKHHNPEYGEVVDVFVRETGSVGAWTSFSVFPSVMVEGGVEEITITGLTAATGYDVGYRYRRGTQVTTGYEGDPPDWVHAHAADSKTTFTTGASERAWSPVGGIGWSRSDSTTEKVHLVWTGGDVGVGTEIWRALDYGNALYALVHTAGAGATTYDYPLPGDESESERYCYFKVRSVGATLFSGWVEVWTGPLRPQGDANQDGMFADGEGPRVSVDWITLDVGNGVQYTDPDYCNIGVEWRNGVASGSTQVWEEIDGGGSSLLDTVAYPGTYLLIGSEGRRHTYAYKVRHKQTVDGKDDFSDFTPQTTFVVD